MLPAPEACRHKLSPADAPEPDKSGTDDARGKGRAGPYRGLVAQEGQAPRPAPEKACRRGAPGGKGKDRQARKGRPPKKPDNRGKKPPKRPPEPPTDSPFAALSALKASLEKKQRTGS